MSHEGSVVDNKHLIMQLRAGLVTGSAADLGEAARKSGLPLLALCALLSDPATGTPQGAEATRHIGVMPNLQAIAQSAAVASPLSAPRPVRKMRVNRSTRRRRRRALVG